MVTDHRLRVVALATRGLAKVAGHKVRKGAEGPKIDMGLQLELEAPEQLYSLVMEHLQPQMADLEAMRGTLLVRASSSPSLHSQSGV